MKHLTRLLMITIISLSSINAFAQTDLELEPFTDEAYQIEGVRPVGWQAASAGFYVRGSAPTDIAGIAIQAAPASLDDVVSALLPQLQLEALPEIVDTIETDALTWSWYNVSIDADGLQVAVNLALSEQDGTTYIILLQSLTDEEATLQETLFFPVLEALAPTLAEPVEKPYLEEAVTFTNGDITLAGTLSLPETNGQHPAVVLMTGSGPQDRDEMVIPGFRIFELIADELTRQGIAVLRYDDRGVGESTGDYNTASIEDLASDGQAAIDYLLTRDDINPDQVGVLGHSEGGVYASILGATPDSQIAFIISMAGPVLDGQTLIMEQTELIMRAENTSEAAITTQLDFMEATFPLVITREWDAVRDARYESALAIWDLLTDDEKTSTGFESAESYAEFITDTYMASVQAEWYATLLETNPAEGYAQITVPVLAIFGGLDIQVPATNNAEAMTIALETAGNNDFSVVILDDANHLFQSAITGYLGEYQTLPFEFTEEFLPTISEWLLERVTIVQ